MFSYFSAKSKIIGLYPRPLYPRIIEPFCGSAAYACRYYRRKCWVNDKYDVVANIWKWIINATEDDIRALPDLNERGINVRELGLDPVVEAMLGLTGCAIGTSSPRRLVNSFACARNGGASATVRFKGRLLDHVGKLSHWRVTNLSYDQLPDVECTWFIDPVYQKIATDQYVHKKLDYDHLAEWCRSRRGQVIVCEGSGADWLPFTPLTKPIPRRAREDTYQELIWYRSDRKDEDLLDLE